MVLFLFTKAILEGGLLKLFVYCRHTRDFRYIDEIVEAALRGSGLDLSKHSPIYVYFCLLIE
jgi:hypothetical protein